MMADDLDIEAMLDAPYRKVRLRLLPQTLVLVPQSVCLFKSGCFLSVCQEDSKNQSPDGQEERSKR